MLGFYRLSEEKIKDLPRGSKDIELNIYDLCCPLVTDEELPKDIKYLYEMLDIPIIKFEELKNYDENEHRELIRYIKEFKEYLKLNIEIEMLEEGKIGHTLRVGRYAKELCDLENVNRELSKKIYIGALFHDIGKIKVPKKITSKPGKLTDKEFEVMKQHSKYGYEILCDYLDDETLDMILSHHERCDKSGYPKGIYPSLGAKIIGIADSYDAMLSNRVYKKNKSLSSTLEELIRCTITKENGGKGILYDESLVRKFVDFHGYDILKRKFIKS